MNRNGDWLQTYSGIQFWPLDAKPDEITIEDIAHALSNLCRFGGHSKSFYSVAEHSIWGSILANKENKLTALLHDASEAYLVDIPRPVKRFLPDYKEAELRLEKAISEKFNLVYPYPDEIKEIDNSLLLAEQEQLMGKQTKPWNVNGKAAKVELACYSPELAERIFLRLFYIYMNKQVESLLKPLQEKMSMDFLILKETD